jgi:hypothetical protein
MTFTNDHDFEVSNNVNLLSGDTNCYFTDYNGREISSFAMEPNSQKTLDYRCENPVQDFEIRVLSTDKGDIRDCSGSVRTIASAVVGNIKCFGEIECVQDLCKPGEVYTLELRNDCTASGISMDYVISSNMWTESVQIYAQPHFFGIPGEVSSYTIEPSEKLPLSSSYPDGELKNIGDFRGTVTLSLSPMPLSDVILSGSCEFTSSVSLPEGRCIDNRDCKEDEYCTGVLGECQKVPTEGCQWDSDCPISVPECPFVCEKTLIPHQKYVGECKQVCMFNGGIQCNYNGICEAGETTENCEKDCPPDKYNPFLSVFIRI